MTLVAFTLVVCVMASGCTGEKDSGPPRPFRPAGETTTLDVLPAEAFTVEAATATVAGAPGAVTEPGKMKVTPVELHSPPAEIADVPVDSVAPGVNVQFTSTQVGAPVKVIFDDVPVDTAAVAVHVSDDGKWTPLESTRDGATLTVETRVERKPATVR